MSEQRDILSLPVLPADFRIPYGTGRAQFGDLWLPKPKEGTRLPVAVFLHGGWWKSEYDLGYAGYVCAALKRQGIACWSIEYRRVGSTGGGWPATFQDVAQGFDFIAELEKKYPLDLSRVVALGHSAGGHLAFWLAGRQHIDPKSEIYQPRPRVPLCGVIGLAGAVDLGLTIELAGHGIFAHDRSEVVSMMGGSPEDLPARYKAGDPGELLPLVCPQSLVQGTRDDQIPGDLPARWAAKAKQAGSPATVHMLPGCDHFDVVDPESSAWPVILKEVKSMLAMP